MTAIVEAIFVAGTGGAPMQRLERKQNATGLAPKRGFIAAQPIDREIRQIG